MHREKQDFTSKNLTVRYEGAHLEFFARNGQPLSQRVSNIVDRYAFIVDSRRAQALALFTEKELNALALGMKPLETKRTKVETLLQEWMIGIPGGSAIRAKLIAMDPIDFIALAEAIEGRAIALD